MTNWLPSMTNWLLVGKLLLPPERPRCSTPRNCWLRSEWDALETECPSAMSEEVVTKSLGK